MTAQCPICGEMIGLRNGVPMTNRLVRCGDCFTRLYIASEQPVRLRVFRSHGLAFRGGPVDGVWATIAPPGISSS